MITEQEINSASIEELRTEVKKLNLELMKYQVAPAYERGYYDGQDSIIHFLKTKATKRFAKESSYVKAIVNEVLDIVKECNLYRVNEYKDGNN